MGGLIGVGVIRSNFSGLGSAGLDWGFNLGEKKIIKKWSDLVIINLWRGEHYLFLNNN